MANFHVLWDKKSEIAHVVCGLSDVDLNEGLVLVSRQLADGSMTPCGVFPIELEDSSFSTVFALAVPQIQDQPVYLHFELFSGDATNGVHVSENIELAESPAHTQSTGIGKKWCIEDDGDQANLCVFDGQEAAPNDTISQVYFSRRDGDTVAPCVNAALDGAGGVLELSAKMADVRSMDDTGVGFRVAELSVNTIAKETALDTRIQCFSLSASLHVLSLLEDDKMRLQRDDNFCETEIRLDNKLQGQAQIMLGKDDANLWPEHACVDPKTKREIGFLDRIVIETSPPATFVHRSNDGNPVIIGRNGVAILSLSANGKWFPDEGRLVDRIGREESSFSVIEESSFISKMAARGYSVNRANTQDVTDISAFVYAWTSKRMEERLKGLGRQLQPGNFSIFRRAPEVFSALSGLDSDAVSRRDGLALGTNFANLPAGDAVRKLGEIMLAAKTTNKSNASRQIVSRWANDPRLNGWVVFAAANDEAVRHAAEAGLILDVNGLSMLLSRDDQSITNDVKSMAREIKFLIDAGIFSAEEKNALQGLEDLDLRKKRLRVLQKNATQTIDSIVSGFGPFEKLPNQSVDRLVELAKLQEDDSEMQPAPDRIAQFFAETTQQAITGLLSDEAQKTFTHRVGKMLRQSINESSRKIERLVKAGLDDPITLRQGNVISIGLGENETAIFSPKIDETLIDWLHDTSPQPAIVEVWRKSLRESYRQFTGLKHNTKI